MGLFEKSLIMDKITKAEIRQRLGNVSQLRELLFGEQIESYEAKSKEYNYRLNQLEADFHEFKLITEKNLKELENNLVSKINSVANTTEDKISYVNSHNLVEHQKINEELTKISKESYRNIDFLQNSINDHHSSLKQEITQSKSTIDRELQLLKRQVFDKLESSLAELSNTKLSHNDLADVLFELCLKLKDPGASLELHKHDSNSEVEETHSQNGSDLAVPDKK